MTQIDAAEFDRSVAEKVRRHMGAIYRRTDLMFANLLVLQWIAGMVAVVYITPWTWIGAGEHYRAHVWLAVLGGALLCSLSVPGAVLRPGKLSTRMAIACAQLSFSCLLIQLTGGRLETHFHVFGSLAFLAAYRDWRVLVPATLIVAADHFVRGVWWPESVFGDAAASPWRWLEHVGWVLFADSFLVLIIRQSMSDVWELARHTTQVEQTIENLKQSADEIRKLSLVVSKARYGVVIADRDGRAEWINESFARLTGYAEEDVLGKDAWGMLWGPGTDQKTAEQIRRQIARGKSVSAELVNYTKDRREFWTSLRIEPVRNEDGELSHFISTQTDISERKAREAELQRTQEESESANRAKSDFLANMSHEIRTPLNGILGFTELLRHSARGFSESERQDYLEAIDTSGRHLLSLINDILDLSKVEAGHFEFERIDCSPHQIIAEVASVLRVRAQEKGISLDYRWESGIPETIVTDPHRLKQLLINLVGNAIKFTEQGSVLIVASLDENPEASSQPFRGRLRLEVRDTGIGIPAEKLEMIFEPFAQADSSVTRKHGGTGLGLAICRRIAAALGGELRVTSEVGRGSVFSATIATGDMSGVAILKQPPRQVVSDVIHQELASDSLTGLNLLLVDDGDTNRKLLTVTLRRSGANVVTAENGKIALDLAAQADFDLMLMDMQMPIMDGYTATRRLREGGYNKPIIALTAHAMKGDREKCEAAGCSGYLTKPINLEKLVQTVLTATNHTPPEPNAAGLVPEPRRAGSGDSRTTSPQPAEVRSSLPTDDPEIGAIVREFVEKLPTEIQRMQAANSGRQYDQLAQLAHWLKGAGGTVGFECFTEPARELERLAKERNGPEINRTIERLRSLKEVLSVS